MTSTSQNTTEHIKTVSFSMRGFASNPEKIEEQMGVKATSQVLVGQRTKSCSTYRKSYVEFTLGVSVETRMVEMIPALLQHLGGLEHVAQIVDTVKPEEVTIEFLLPVRNSELVEDGYINPESIAAAHRLRAAVGFFIP